MTWDLFIEQERKEQYFQELMIKVNEEYQKYDVFPPYEQIFRAFYLTPLDKVKVVLIGQDPYQSKGYANGLSFSVNEGVKIPKSLQNIFKELVSDLNLPMPKTGDLTPWALNGVLLLNTILTVRENEPLSHQKLGWDMFTNKVINILNKMDQPIVFLLLGNSAKKYKLLLNNPNHLIIETSHPSPLGAYHGFIGSHLFSKCNTFLHLSNDFWRLP